MKSILYIILGVIFISLIGSSLPNISNGFSSQRTDLYLETVNQHVPFGFFETYTWAEVLSALDPADRFFQLVNSEGRDKSGCLLGSCQESQASELWDYIHSDPFQKQLPADIRFAWGASQELQNRILFALKQPAGALKGPLLSHIREAKAKKSEHNASYELLISFTEEGTKLWAELTGANVGRSIAIVSNDLVYAAPMVREAIKHGECSISGNYAESDLTQILGILEQ
jgi:SecD/SecF fusion protein